MNADRRGWILKSTLPVIACLTLIASQAHSDESLFLLTPQIERLGGEALRAENQGENKAHPNPGDSLRYDGLRLTGPVDVESPAWRLIRVGNGVLVAVPAIGPAPIILDFAHPPARGEGSEDSEGLEDHPTAPAAPPRDDSYLLAEREFTFGGLTVSR